MLGDDYLANSPFQTNILRRDLSQKLASFCDIMKRTSTTRQTQSLNKSLLASVRSRKHTGAFSSRDFEALAKPAAVRKALERLVKRGELRRIRRGYYDIPRSHPIVGLTAPDPMALVRSMMKNSNARWQVSGAYAANQLHLSEQVPAKIVILTDGISKKIKLDNLTLDFRRASPRHLLGAGNMSGMVIQAFRHLRPTGLTPSVIARLRKQLDAATKTELRRLSPSLAAWMRPFVQQIAENTKS